MGSACHAGMTHPDMEMERERRKWESDEWRDTDKQKAMEARRDEKIEVKCSCIPFKVSVDELPLSCWSELA